MQEENRNKIKSHSELDSESSTYAVSQKKQQRQAWKIPNQVWDDGLNFMGFTLIELLVVVLIIGILAAVAVPQYQKAVEKSKAAQAFVLLKSLGEAVSVHRLSTGTTPTSFDELDVDLSGWTGNTRWSLSGSPYVLQTRSNADWSLQLYKDSGGAIQIYLGRLSGKYAGGGFIFQATGRIGEYQGNWFCAERKSDGVVFNETAGSYCREIFKGTLDSEGSILRLYQLP